MPALTASDYKQIRRTVYRKGEGKEELQALSNLPGESTFLAVFQAAENRTVAAFSLFRSDLESLLGIPTNAASLALAKKVYKAYVAWKLEHI